jgi:hypothetical protein
MNDNNEDEPVSEKLLTAAIGVLALVFLLLIGLLAGAMR